MLLFLTLGDEVISESVCKYRVKRFSILCAKYTRRNVVFLKIIEVGGGGGG